MKKRIVQIVLIILIVAWMYMVFGFSNDTAEVSSGLSLKISRLFTKDENVLRILEPIIRKIAHLTEYMVRWVFSLWI